ncbi:hypothetical protein PG994_013997 [Apiospora phragmitis]|uniref:2EXR domain-containing protein n=1 Tax=Apiospora phragmitis TaxID=2905665 RepID=A0ABR1T323_9PEZI
MEKGRGRRATASKRRAETQPLDHFHLFPKLPLEIQLMVWSIWRQDVPVIRHHMSLFDETRFYGALNPATKEFVRVPARSAASDQDDPLDPMEYKIRFTNQVQTMQGKYDDPLGIAYRSPSVSHEPGFRHLKPAFVWVNFEKDIFTIQNIDHRHSGSFRFLMHNIGSKVPKPLAPDHWASRIQTLALQTECQPPSEYGRHSFSRSMEYGQGPKFSRPLFMGIDDQVLQIMASLKRILLVMKGFAVCELVGPLMRVTDNPGGYLDYAAIQAAHKEEKGDTFMHYGIRRYDDWCAAQLSSSEIVGELRQKLDGMGKQGVEVKLVVDMLVGVPTHIYV